MRQLFFVKDERGGLIIEVLLSIMFVMVFSAALASLAHANTVVTTSSRLKSQAVALARESMEQAYAMKRDGWSSVNKPAGTYTIAVVAGHYELQASAPSVPVGGTIFTRTIQLAIGTRTSGRLTAGAGVPDDQVRLVTVTVEWTDRGQSQHVTLTGYLTNWKEATP